MSEEPIQQPTNNPEMLSVLKQQPHVLHDIMLDLHIEIGRAKIKISDLMNMAEGSVIQLEQKSSDPLIIYANDKPIAKGQIISSNGKYNIRIL